MILSRVRFGQIAAGLALLAGAATVGLGGEGDRPPGDGAATSNEHWDAPAYVAAVETARAAADEARHQRTEPVDPAGPNPSVPPPHTRGDDPALDDLWHRCEQGSGAACDQLFHQAPLGSDYEAFGLNCGNRLDVLHCSALDAPPAPPPAPTTAVAPPAG